MFQVPPPLFRPELGILRHQGPFYSDHDYQTNREKLDLEVKLDQNSDNVKLEYNLLTKWRSIFKVYTLCPTQNQQILVSSSLSHNSLTCCSTYNVVQSALYIVPAYHDGKLFVRYMEQGIYKGFTSKFISALTSVYKYTIK